MGEGDIQATFDDGGQAQRCRSHALRTDTCKSPIACRGKQMGGRFTGGCESARCSHEGRGHATETRIADTVTYINMCKVQKV
eukprot:scaffold13200_cov21-Tisochrysis_lutea.AAC.4